MASSRKKRSLKWIFFLLVPLLGGAAFFSLKAIGRSAPRIEPEKLVKAERIDLARSVVATGKIEPVTKVEIKSKASGIIQNLPVNVGDVVHKDHVICKLDENNVLPQVRQFQAALCLAEANLKSTQADYERYKVDAAGPDVPFLKRDMDRARGLYHEQLTARNLVEDAEKNYEMAVNRQKSADREPGRSGGGHRQGAGRHRTGARGAGAIGRRSAQHHHRLANRRAWCSRATARWATRSAPF